MNLFALSWALQLKKSPAQKHTLVILLEAEYWQAEEALHFMIFCD